MNLLLVSLGGASINFFILVSLRLSLPLEHPGLWHQRHQSGDPEPPWKVRAVYQIRA